MLDNCQDVSGPSFHALLREALSELPLDRYVIVVSRGGVPAELSRLLASRSLQTIGWDDLRLTRDETRAIAISAGLVQERAIAAVEQLSDGWAAALTLLLTNLSRGGTVASFEGSASKDVIFDYFAGELFDRADAATQDLLLRTALFPQFDVGMAEAISGNRRAGITLEYLYRQHFFTERRLDSKVTYHYHDLFRAFLLARLSSRHDRSELEQLERQVGRMLIAAGLIDEGVPLLIKGGDVIGAREVIVDRGAQLLAEGRSNTLRQWISALPHEQDPWLLYWLGLSQMPTEPLLAEATLDRAFGLFAAMSDIRGQVLAAASVLESRYFSMANWGDMARWIQAMESLLSTGDPLSVDLQVRAYATLVNAVLFSRPEDSRVESYIDHAIAAIRHSEDVGAKATATAIVLNSLNLVGRLQDAAALSAEIEGIVSSRTIAPVARAFLGGHYAFNAYLSGNPGEALLAIDRSLGLIEQHGLMSVAGLLVCYKFIILVTRGRADEGAPLLKELERQVLPNRVADLAIIDLMKVWVASNSGASTDEVLGLARAALQSVQAVRVVLVQHAMVMDTVVLVCGRRPVRRGE